jgi:TRAP-type C4-dicarboxylate transport system substrate-binding protein
VYCRADLSRTLQLVVALFLTPAATGVSAREFRAADTQNKDYPTVQGLGYMGSLIAERSGGRHQIRALPFRQLGDDRPSLATTDPYKGAAMAGTYARVTRDPAMAQLIERVRKVE